MQLPSEETELFFRLWFTLLSYVSECYPAVLRGTRAPDEIRGMPLTRVHALIEPLYEHPELIDAFAEANPRALADDELEIVRNWRHFIRGQFVVLRQLKAHAIFLDMSDPPKAYGVLGLNTPFEVMIDMPALVQTTLLPFKGRIIYDGLLSHSNLSFGPGIRASLSASYERARSLYGVVTQLPFTPPVSEQSGEDLLRFYLKNERNREEYWGEIHELLRKNPSLNALYYQETGKRYARAYKRRLRDWSIAPAWFAVLNDVVLASGRDRQEVTDNFKRLVSEEKWDYVHVFRWAP